MELFQLGVLAEELVRTKLLLAKIAAPEAEVAEREALAEELRVRMPQMRDFFAKFSLIAAHHHAVLLTGAVQNPNPGAAWASVAGGRLGELELALVSDLKGNFFFNITPNEASFYEREMPAGEAVASAFPSASTELREAGTCYALGRNTAAVFFAMRAMSIAVRVLAQHLKVPKRIHLNQPEGEVLNHIEGKLKKRLARLAPAKKKSSAARTTFEQFSDLARRLLLAKDAWRGSVAHARSTYDATGSIRVLVAVQDMIDLAQKLGLREQPIDDGFIGSGKGESERSAYPAQGLAIRCAPRRAVTMSLKSDSTRRDKAALEHVQLATRRTLDRHGYTFQYKVIKEIARSAEASNTGWRFEASEFPVSVSNQSSRIDAIFSRGDGAQRAFLVVECKRVDPRKSNWCFVASPRPDSRNTPSGQAEYLYFSWREKDTGTRLIRAQGVESLVAGPTYDLGFEVKQQDATGDQTGNSRKAIDDACFQLALGSNGLVEHFSRLFCRASKLEMHLKLYSVLLTTAKLYSSTVDLTDSSIETGELSVDQAPLRPERWVYYRYHQDPRTLHAFSPLSTDRSDVAMRHDPESHESPIRFFDMGRDMDMHYVRTIAIVSSQHIAEFIRSFSA